MPLFRMAQCLDAFCFNWIIYMELQNSFKYQANLVGLKKETLNLNLERYFLIVFSES